MGLVVYELSAYHSCRIMGYEAYIWLHTVQENYGAGMSY